MRSRRSRRSLKVSHTQTSVPCETLKYNSFYKHQLQKYTCQIQVQRYFTSVSISGSEIFPYVYFRMYIRHSYLYLLCFRVRHLVTNTTFIVSTGGIRWILWFSVRYATTTACREIFGINALRGKLHHLGSPNLQNNIIGGGGGGGGGTRWPPRIFL